MMFRDKTKFGYATDEEVAARRRRVGKNWDKYHRLVRRWRRWGIPMPYILRWLNSDDEKEYGAEGGSQKFMKDDVDVKMMLANLERESREDKESEFEALRRKIRNMCSEELTEPYKTPRRRGRPSKKGSING